MLPSIRINTKFSLFISTVDYIQILIHLLTTGRVGSFTALTEHQAWIAGKPKFF